MYLAGLIADDARMTKKDLQRWVAKAMQNTLGSDGGMGGGGQSAWMGAGAGMD